nr:transposase [Nocardiopsis akebiae]
MEYEAERYGRAPVVVDRRRPSSKTCSACGHLPARLSSGTRSWTCPSCRTRHDRDLNATGNVLAAGRVAAREAVPGDACGAGVGRQGASLPLSAAKQETGPVRVAARAAPGFWTRSEAPSPSRRGRKSSTQTLLRRGRPARGGGPPCARPGTVRGGRACLTCGVGPSTPFRGGISHTVPAPGRTGRRRVHSSAGPGLPHTGASRSTRVQHLAPPPARRSSSSSTGWTA